MLDALLDRAAAITPLEQMGRGNDLGDAVRLAHAMSAELERVANELYDLAEQQNAAS